MNYKRYKSDWAPVKKLSFIEWIEENSHWRIRTFIKRFRRWWKYSKVLWKMPSWNEYDQLFKVMQLQLSIMAEEFTKSPITMSAEQDAKDMQTVITLLSRYMNEYYSYKYSTEGIIRDYMEDNSMESLIESFNKPTVYREGYSDEGLLNAYDQDRKCLDLALKIIAHKSPGWWQ
jgi:hypothetical protein